MRKDLSISISNLSGGASSGAPLKELLLECPGTGTWERRASWIGSNLLVGDFSITYRLEDLMGTYNCGTTTLTTPPASGTYNSLDLGHQHPANGSNTSRWWQLGTWGDVGNTDAVAGAFVVFTRTGSTATMEVAGDLKKSFTGVSTADMYPYVTFIGGGGSSVTLYNADDQVIDGTSMYEGSSISLTLSARQDP
jgi:hypothetical protein